MTNVVVYIVGFTITAIVFTFVTRALFKDKVQNDNEKGRMTKEECVKWLQERADVIARTNHGSNNHLHHREVLALVEAAQMISMGLEPDGSSTK